VFRKCRGILEIVTRRLSDILTSAFVCDTKLTLFETTRIYGLYCYRKQSDADVALRGSTQAFSSSPKIPWKNVQFSYFPGLYISHPLKTVYYISFAALLMPLYFTEPPCTIAFSLLSQYSLNFFNPYIWKDVMLLQTKTVLRLKSTLITPFLPYRNKNEVSDMLKQKNPRCNTEADMFDILIIRVTVGSH
jgi:hypothetical protein